MVASGANGRGKDGRARATRRGSRLRGYHRRVMEKPGSKESEVRQQVRRALAGSPAYAELDPARRAELTAALEDLVLRATDIRVDAVDFPGFVRDLIKGTFDAILDVSTQQMEAYLDLLREATKSVDEFLAGIDDEDKARERQRLLATMVLMGINRIVVEDGVIAVRTAFGVVDDEDDDDE